ncbi:MAG: hypothetical protein K6E54_02385 [Bacteroidaceae bacterium]|nr:hypothetical protein [Bacteroidaceae bacterium]
MRVLSTLIAALFLSTTAVQAQEDDTNMFNHMALGITAGTPGVGLELGMPIGNYVQVRAGATYMPPVSLTTTLKYNKESVDPLHNNETDIKGTANFFNAKILFDFYFSQELPLHLTLGAYINGGKTFDLENVGNEDMLKQVWLHNVSANSNPYSSRADELWGPQLGNYVLLPNVDGKIDGWIETSKLKPYVGLGWGKAVSDKSFDWMVEAGVMFWGQPKVYTTPTIYDEDGNNTEYSYELPKQDTSGSNGGLLKTFTNIQIYPVINFRIGFNMF